MEMEIASIAFPICDSDSDSILVPSIFLDDNQRTRIIFIFCLIHLFPCSVSPYTAALAGTSYGERIKIDSSQPPFAHPRRLLSQLLLLQTLTIIKVSHMTCLRKILVHRFNTLIT